MVDDNNINVYHQSFAYEQLIKLKSKQNVYIIANNLGNCPSAEKEIS